MSATLDIHVTYCLPILHKHRMCIEDATVSKSEKFVTLLGA